MEFARFLDDGRQLLVLDRASSGPAVVHVLDTLASLTEAEVESLAGVLPDPLAKFVRDLAAIVRRTDRTGPWRDRVTKILEAWWKAGLSDRIRAALQALR